jgi:hypothetical protein
MADRELVQRWREDVLLEEIAGQHVDIDERRLHVSFGPAGRRKVLVEEAPLPGRFRPRAFASRGLAVSLAQGLTCM